jgi:hypothetical protein
MRATYRLKTAALDAKMLASAYQSASLGEDPGTVSFKTPGGHTVVTPYSEQAIQHQMNRLGGEKAYYRALGESLQGAAKAQDAAVERARDLDVDLRRSGKAVGGLLLGGLGGAALGSLASKNRNAGLIGAALGGLAGGALGRLSPTARQTGAASVEIDELPELYRQSGEERRLAALQRQATLTNRELQMARHERMYGRLYDDRYYDWPYRRRYYY